MSNIKVPDTVNKRRAKKKTALQKRTIDTTTDSEVVCVSVQKPNSNSVANIIHKNSSGSNNWKTFLESVPTNIKQKHEKLDLNHVKSNSKFTHNSKKNPRSVDPKSMVTCNDLENKFHNKAKITNKGHIPYNNADNVSTNSQSEEKICKGKEKEITKQIAMDCEMVAVDIGVNNNMLARVSLVNAHGNCVYDKFVKPTEPVVSYRTHVSGVRPSDLVNAEDFKTVQQEVADIIKGRILVGHALKNDLRVLYLSHPKRDIRDTSRFHKFREGRTPALKKLAKKYLGVTIQEGEHNSIQDALATMQLYKMFRKEWEASLKHKNWKKKTFGPAQNKSEVLNSQTVDLSKDM